MPHDHGHLLFPLLLPLPFLFLLLLLLHLLFEAVYKSDWPWTCSIAQTDFQFTILLPQSLSTRNTGVCHLEFLSIQEQLVHECLSFNSFHPLWGLYPFKPHLDSTWMQGQFLLTWDCGPVTTVCCWCSSVSQIKLPKSTQIHSLTILEVTIPTWISLGKTPVVGRPVFLLKALNQMHCLVFYSF
jgi:hypothetical protein